MTIAKSPRWAVMIGASLLAVGFSAGCGQIAVPFTQRAGGDAVPVSQVAQDATTVPALTSPATPTPAVAHATGPKTVPVVRDSITETLSLDAVVAAKDQVPVTYPGRGNVADVKVKPGDTVKQGDLLLELEAPHHQWAEDIAHQLDAARTKVASDQANLDRAQAQAASGQVAAAAAAAADKQQQAIADADSALRHAQENLAKVQAGAAPADRQTAQTAVDNAQAALQKAQDFADKLATGPDPDAVRLATRDVTNAQIAATKAQSALDVLTAGPDPTAVREAQGQLTKSQTQLQLAQAAKPDPKLDPAVAHIQHDAAIQDAQLAVDTASAALGKLKQPPASVDVDMARQAVQDAQDGLSAAQAKLDALQAGPDQASLNAAQAAVASARQSVTAAQKNLSDVNSHPTTSELADAKDQVAKAQAGLDAAQRAPTPVPDTNTAALDALQATVDQDQTDVNSLQQTLDATQMPAPFDGTVVAVRVKAGDAITSAKPAFIMAKPGPAIVRADLTDDQAGRLTVGQQATVQFDTSNAAATPIDATIASVTPAAADGSTDASATFAVSWQDGQAPKLGLPVQVNLTLQQKDGVLVVPLSALHISGSHATVEVLNGTLRRLVTVQVGIKTATTAEIVSGLSEGQLVLSGTP